MRQPWILWAASVVLFNWGVSILIDGEAIGASAMNTIGQLPVYPLAFLLIAAGCGGAWDILRDKTDRLAVFLMAPQVAILLAAGWDCLSVVIQSRYADSTARTHGFIFRDQQAMIVTVAFHMIAVLDRHTERLWKRR